MLWLCNLAFLRTLTVEMGGVFDSFACPWDPFLPTRLFCPSLNEGLCLVLLQLVIMCLVNTPGRLEVFLRETRAVDLGEREGEGGNWKL